MLLGLYRMERMFAVVERLALRHGEEKELYTGFLHQHLCSTPTTSQSTFFPI